MVKVAKTFEIDAIGNVLKDEIQDQGMGSDEAVGQVYDSIIAAIIKARYDMDRDGMVTIEDIADSVYKKQSLDNRDKLKEAVENTIETINQYMPLTIIGSKLKIDKEGNAYYEMKIDKQTEVINAKELVGVIGNEITTSYPKVKANDEFTYGIIDLEHIKCE